MIEKYAKSLIRCNNENKALYIHSKNEKKQLYHYGKKNNKSKSDAPKRALFLHIFFKNSPIKLYMQLFEVLY